MKAAASDAGLALEGVRAGYGDTVVLEGVSLAYYGKSPFSLYHNSDLDAIFEKAEATLDPAKQAPLIKQMMAIEQEDLPTITLWQYVDVYAMKKGISYTPGQHGLEVVNLPWVHVAM